MSASFAEHLDGTVLLFIAVLDIVMLTFVGLQSIWRQRVVQLVLVALCGVCFLILFASTTASVIGSYYPRGSLTLVAISLYLTTAGSGAALVYLIIAVTRAGRSRTSQAYALAGHAGAPPLPPMTERAEPPPPAPPPHVPYSHPGLPPIPAAQRGATDNMPLALAIVIICVFAVSLLFRLYGLTQRNAFVSPIMLLSFVVDLVMIAFGAWHARWPHRKVAFSIVLVCLLVLVYFFLTYNYSIFIRYSYLTRYGRGLPMMFYWYEFIAVLRIAAAGTALAYCIGPAFGRASGPVPLAPPPPLPNAR